MKHHDILTITTFRIPYTGTCILWISLTPCLRAAKGIHMLMFHFHVIQHPLLQQFPQLLGTAGLGFYRQKWRLSPLCSLFTDFFDTAHLATSKQATMKERTPSRKHRRALQEESTLRLSGLGAMLFAHQSARGLASSCHVEARVEHNWTANRPPTM